MCRDTSLYSAERGRDVYPDSIPQNESNPKQSKEISTFVSQDIAIYEAVNWNDFLPT